jgi:hypothetical protein
MKAFLICFFAAAIMFTSCRVKDQCELNHEGNIYVTNNTGASVEVFVNGIKVFDLAAGESKTSIQDVGTYTVRCFNSPDEWTFDVAVLECEDAPVVISQ